MNIPKVQNKTNDLIGVSHSMRNVKNLISHAAQSDINVLITGESGTGKEITAKMIHANSKRANKPFVAVNCGAIPHELIESELFGHEKGAFTGAVSSRKGRFELADGGTLFLDEIGDMPLLMQVKLLRVIQERAIERVGGSKSISLDVRIISATHHDLERSIQQGLFREDLFYRIGVFPVELPSLRERIEDIPMLANDLISRLQEAYGASISLNHETLAILQYHQWPGNVRELANLIEQLIALYPNQKITPQHLPKKYHHSAGVIRKKIPTNIPRMLIEHPTNEQELNSSKPINLKALLSQIEVAYIKEAMEAKNGIVVQAAQYLGMRRTTLIEKMKKYGIA